MPMTMKMKTTIYGPKESQLWHALGRLGSGKTAHELEDRGPEFLLSEAERSEDVDGNDEEPEDWRGLTRGQKGAEVEGQGGEVSARFCRNDEQRAH